VASKKEVVMSINKIQFQPGLSMFEFMERYGQEEQCEAALERQRWPDGFRCPRCAGTKAWSFRRAGHPLRQCQGCAHQASLTAGTILQDTKLPLRTWFLAMQLLSQAKTNLAALELRRQLGVSYPTAWMLKHKIIESMRHAEAERQLTGSVQIDDAYLGGERTGGKPGRGSENKVSFVLAVQTIGINAKAHRVCAALLPFRRTALAEFCQRHLVRPLTVFSDGLACFNAAADAGVHQPILTGGGKAGTEHPDLRAVNVMLGNLKTAINGTYHAFKFAKYGARYLADFQFRFNRREDLRRMIGEMTLALARAPVTPLVALREPESAC
jgi:hypothetical protein